MDSIKAPKKLYYEWISGTEVKKEEAVSLINEAIQISEKTKEKLQRQKMCLSWNESLRSHQIGFPDRGPFLCKIHQPVSGRRNPQMAEKILWPASKYEKTVRQMYRLRQPVYKENRKPETMCGLPDKI